MSCILASMEIHEFCSMGGKARAAKLTSQRKSEIAKNAAEVRWLLNRSIKAQDASYAQTLTKSPIPNIEPQIPKPEPKTRKCQTSYCTKEGKERSVHGFKAWCCDEHWG